MDYSRYYSSLKPLLSLQERKHVKLLLEDFERGSGKHLQRLLLLKANHQKNWLEKWWLDYAYLSIRTPLPGIMNITATLPFHHNIWPPEEGRKFEYAGKTLALIFEFWELLRQERLKPDVSKKKRMFSMDQFRRLFSTTRLPGKDMDQLLCLWKTASEGNAPNHVAIFCRGHIFIATPFNERNELICWQQWEKLLRNIQREASSFAYGPGIGCLTSDYRDRWYNNRETLRSICPINQKNLELIESAVLAVSIDEDRPRSESECIRYLLAGNPMNRWADKSTTLVCFASGWVGMTSDHTPFDAMCSVLCTYFAYEYLKLQPEKLEKLYNSHEPPIFRQLEFIVDERVTEAVILAKKVGDEMLADILLEKRPFGHYGKSFISKFKLHPDAYVQMAMQLAYYRLHNKPAPTYETATTREFYHGRTETVRSCTDEAIKWVKAMDDDSIKLPEKVRQLRIAVDLHVTNMENCKQMQGCDRHLFGLYMIALENQLPIHPIFTDSSWTKSGGGGNFILSSSLVGYSPVSGGTTAMCENGYGVFYSIENERINISASSWKRSKETNAFRYWQNLENALLDMKKLLTDSKKFASKL
ncbi:hypothetical protein QYM36_007743 [Artemia franciscana]|uniref:Choline/carnitine acyltransferase domain-containing protein n=1 Tax=Artemia franciscana TaxID=6661 RepID=A0AA88ID12_ARTSF|nr:hypothetical protein QYM36_007743 [Artemia franciscana]